MLHEIDFANSIGVVTVFFFLVFYLGSIIAPNLFRFLRNAQFLGADINQFTPKRFSRILLTLFVTSWIQWKTFRRLVSQASKAGRRAWMEIESR